MHPSALLHDLLFIPTSGKQSNSHQSNAQHVAEGGSWLHKRCPHIYMWCPAGPHTGHLKPTETGSSQRLLQAFFFKNVFIFKNEGVSTLIVYWNIPYY